MNRAIWIDANNKKVDMSTMTEEELQTAFTLMCNREYVTFKKANELWAKIDTYNRIKEQLLETAQSKQITLNYPDQIEKRHPFGDYFANERKNNTIKSPKAVISAGNSVVDS